MPSAKYSCSGSPLMFSNGRTAIDGWSGSAGWPGSAAAAPPPGIARYTRTGRSIFLSARSPRCSKPHSSLPCTSSWAVPETQMQPGSASSSQPGGHVHAVAENTLVLENDVAEVHSHPKQHAPVGRDIAVALVHRLLQRHRAFHGPDGARKRGQEPIAGSIHYRASEAPHHGKHDRLVRLQLSHRRRFVLRHQARVARYVGRQDRREPTFGELDAESVSAIGSLPRGQGTS